MKLRTLATALALAFSLSATTGCIIHAKDDDRRSRKHVKKRSHKKKSKRCKPSHYWDGKKCRHKGRGKGARKHDY